MTWSIAAGLLMVAWAVWAMGGFVDLPNAVGRPAPEGIRQRELLVAWKGSSSGCRRISGGDMMSSYPCERTKPSGPEARAWRIDPHDR